MRAALGTSQALRGWLALLVVYVVWGSTFTGIQVAVRAMPPLLMAGTRYLLAGVVLYAVAGRSGRWRWRRLSWPELYSSAAVGLLLLLGANGLLSWSEQKVPSGLAALIIGTVPLWIAVLGLAGRRSIGPGRLGWVGVMVGLVGVGVLASPTTAGHMAPLYTAVLLAAALFWASGSLYALRAPLPDDIFIASAVEMVFGGLGLVIAGLASGETTQVHWAHIMGGPLVAFAWLVLGGSLLGYTCYAYALKVLPTSTVATYAYVNPVVALVLGFFILGQGLTRGSALAAALITVGVVLMVSGPHLTRRRQRRLRTEVPRSDTG
ncbi:MAG TPA: EamA family transporter [Candidatus Nanopelagicaceae bacterium]|nr:EamA family transporter [Candidatus Nanopelagicaceae bacterium]